MVNVKSAVTVAFLFIGIAIIAGQTLNLFSITAADRGTDRIRYDGATQPYFGSSEQNTTNETLNNDSMSPMRNYTRFELEQLEHVYGQERMEQFQESLSRQDEVVRGSYVIEVASPERSGKPATASKNTQAFQAATAARNNVKQSIKDIASSESWYGFGQDDPSAQITKEYQRTINGLTVRNISKEEIDEVSRLDDVEDVHPNYRFYPTLDESVPHIGAPNVWDGENNGVNSTVEAVNQTYRTANETGEDNIRGGNQTIAVIDTGVDYTHPALGGCTRQEFRSGNCDKVRGGYDFADNDSDPMDNLGHGTHVASTIAGTTYPRGVAPNATIYAYKVFSEDSRGATTDDIVAAIEQAVEDDVDVISMSLGANIPPGNVLDRAVNNAVRQGTPVVVAAGNSGSWIGHNSVTSPGTAEKSITVGAYTLNDEPTAFTSRGPVQLGSNFSKSYRLKPDVAAPGENICAAKAAGTDGKTCIDDRHVSLSGTSMAAPHVSGLVALMRQKHPEWNATIIKNQLEASSHPVDRPYFGGSGRINASKTVSTKRSDLRAMIDSTTQTGTRPLETVLTCTSNIQGATKTLRPGQGKTRVTSTDDIVREYTYNQTKTYQPTCTVRHGVSSDQSTINIDVRRPPEITEINISALTSRGLSEVFYPDIATRDGEIFVAFDISENVFGDGTERAYTAFTAKKADEKRWTEPEILGDSAYTRGKTDPTMHATDSILRTALSLNTKHFLSNDTGTTWSRRDTSAGNDNPTIYGRTDPAFTNNQKTGRVMTEGNTIYYRTASNNWKKKKVTTLEAPSKIPSGTEIADLDAEIRNNTLHIVTLTDRDTYVEGKLSIISVNLKTGNTSTERVCSKNKKIRGFDLEVDDDAQVAGFSVDSRLLQVFDSNRPCGRPITQFKGLFDYEINSGDEILVLMDTREEGLIGGDITYYTSKTDGNTWSTKQVIQSSDAISWAPRVAPGKNGFHVVWQETESVAEPFDLFYAEVPTHSVKSCSEPLRKGIIRRNGTSCGTQRYSPTYDLNRDEEINVEDLAVLKNTTTNASWCSTRFEEPPNICKTCSKRLVEGLNKSLGSECGSKRYNATFDLNEDGRVNTRDIRGLYPEGERWGNRTWCQQRFQNPPVVCPVSPQNESDTPPYPGNASYPGNVSYPGNRTHPRNATY